MTGREGIVDGIKQLLFSYKRGLSRQAQRKGDVYLELPTGVKIRHEDSVPPRPTAEGTQEGIIRSLSDEVHGSA